MKLNIFIFTIMFIIGSCGKDLRRMIGADYNNKTNRIEKDQDSLEQRVLILENQVNDLILDINLVQDQIETLEDADADLLNSINAVQNSLQLQINNVVADIAQLEMQESIVEFVDPCGNGPGYDEVLLKTSTGKLVAYFESGANRFLTVLTPGNYRTTDQQACNFQVTSSGTII